MRRPLLLACLCLAGCLETTSDALQGHVGHLSVTVLSDTCTPRRDLLDGGSQFVGFRADGGVVVTTSLGLFWGPMSDGGTTATGSRQDSVLNQAISIAPSDSITTMACSAMVYQWIPPGSLSLDGGLPDGGYTVELNQNWTVFDAGCIDPSAPLVNCSVNRVLTFAPETPCRLNCLVTDAVGDVHCGC
jgi:hypothetical protein